ncbi:hypothetical protein HPB48_000102 [Haemaphysalis longicornis]|uniref:Gustatory receptor n=1 Tax=Haemaphysalis longicornis TaxID=44386 RepID=A0A9J6GPY3_HAELO|nr:hypothetical protein HPB48_000102 [Haemaphysalis longicornis]
MLLRPYFWYSLLCFSVWLTTDVVAALWAVMYGSTRRGAFVSTVYLSTQIVVLIKTVLVWVALAFEARRLRRLIEKSAHFEFNRGIIAEIPKKRFGRREMRVWGRVLVMIMFMVNRNIDTLPLFEVENYVYAIPIVVALSASAALLVVYDSLYSTVLKALIEVFTAYLRYEVEVLKQVRTEAAGGRATKSVEDCRIDFNVIQRLVKGTNQLMRFALLIAYAGNLLALCAIVYLLVDTANTPWSVLLYAGGYGALMWLDMIDTGVSAEAMKVQVG